MLLVRRVVMSQAHGSISQMALISIASRQIRRAIADRIQPVSRPPRARRVNCPTVQPSPARCCCSAIDDGESFDFHIAIGNCLEALNRESYRRAALAVLSVSWISLVVPAHADEYQDAITKAFPGFKIMSRTEFTKEIQKTVKGNPALITGRFNDDELLDFAAMIRSDSKQKGQLGGEYYRGMYVVCHGINNGGHACQILGQGAFFLPHHVYLTRADPGTVGCYDDHGKKVPHVVKRNAVGTETTNTASLRIHQPDGSYFNCITAD